MPDLQIVLASRPIGTPIDQNFRIEQCLLPDLTPGKLGLEVLYASIDPYMRTKMAGVASYTPPYEIGAVISARTICRVERSEDARFAVGDVVSAFTGWQTRAVVDGSAVTPVDISEIPATAYLGVLGMPGLTAYGGLLRFGRPVFGETLVVAAALGPVGATVAQIAGQLGLHVVAVVGGQVKAELARSHLGLAHVIDHRDPEFVNELADLTPRGVDVYFENVGGHVADAVYPRLNLYGRVPLCGMVAEYNHTDDDNGPDRLPSFYRQVLAKSIDVRGFISAEYADELGAEFQKVMGQWVRDGTIKHLEHVTDGLENAPSALIDMLRGGNVGKAVVRVA